jgi:NAD(P)-dependent dehydrogenase (short-subunit alcohol dehydrogenase family)
VKIVQKIAEQLQRNVLVTGANGGVGLALTKRLCEDGWHVFAGVRTPAAASLLQALGRQRVSPIIFDVTAQDDIESMRSYVSARVGDEGLQALVNCAGIIVDGPLELIPVEHFRHQFEVNVTAPFAVTRALLPLLRRGCGRVVNIGAVSARTTAPFFGPIAASKAALASLNDAMRMEFAPFGIKVALIEPGGLQTGIWKTSAAFQIEGLKSQSLELVNTYRPAMDAMRAAFAKAGLDGPEVVVNAAIDALTRRGGPRPRVLVGKGAAQLAFLSCLPIRLRDSLLMSMLGIDKTLKPAAQRWVHSESTQPAPAANPHQGQERTSKRTDR